jgi:serine/threonine-protein kinase
MPDEARIRQLLEDVLDSGRSPEEVCAAAPELLPEVRSRLHKLRQLERQIEAAFPTPTPTGSDRPRSRLLPDAPLPRIAGYEVAGVLGRGGMGIVFRARHIRLNRTVALKMALSAEFAGSRERERFQREAEAVAALRHPNIVQVYDVGEEDGRPYFTMEYVEGGSLAQRLSGTPEPAGPAAALVATLAEAVRAAHASSIVHRDLKPANVLLTADGTPKISDFGLARRLDSDAGLTRTGIALGTPSYMAPEQVDGEPDAVGPHTDVYALGAILYELLTGRPPFRAATSSETLRQVRLQDPVPPSRLNASVPRDLETICLKCLSKEPGRRYATAAALADDLGWFQRGEPIAARPAGLSERIAKLVRRNPTLTVLAAVGVLLAVGAVIWGFVFAVQRAQRRDAVAMDLGELASLQANTRWAEARAVLERAEARFEGGGPADVRRRLAQARHDLDLAIRLDDIRLARATRGSLAFYKAQADHEYTATFQEAGFGKNTDPPADVAARIVASPVSAALVAALYDWAACAPGRAERAWILDVARHADSTPGEWHASALDPAVWDDRRGLEKLTDTAPMAGEPVSLLLALGERLRAEGGNSVPLTRRVQQEHPGDFWANLAVGTSQLPDAPRQAVGALRAALASRPDAAVGYCAVGDCFRLQMDLDAATGYYEKALRRDPKYARTYNNLGLVLQLRGRVDEAIEYHHKALQLDPDYAWAHYDLGNALRTSGRLDLARDEYREALRRDPHNPAVLDRLRSLMMRQGRGQEVLAEWRTDLDANPPGHESWFGYAELCLYLQQPDEYRRATRALLDRFGDSNDAFICERVGRACLLLPGPGDEVKRAAALAEHAVGILQSTPPRLYPYSRFALGLAQYRLGRYSSAIPIMTYEANDVMGPCPRLVVAMSQFREGQVPAARQTLAAAILSYDWRAPLADNRDAWICHILRREAEALMLPNLPAFLAGKYQPRDNDERCAFVGACQFADRTRATARLYADAFVAAPGLADDLAAGHRLSAARAAAAAGCGHGADAGDLTPAERADWCRQARRWLREDLALWRKKLNSDRGSAPLVLKTLAQWQADPDLAGLRRAEVPEQQSAEDRAESEALWNEVGALLRRAQGGK